MDCEIGENKDENHPHIFEHINGVTHYYLNSDVLMWEEHIDCVTWLLIVNGAAPVRSDTMISRRTQITVIVNNRVSPYSRRRRR